MGRNMKSMCFHTGLYTSPSPYATVISLSVSPPQLLKERVKETEQEDILDALPVDVCGVLLVHYLGARSVAP